MSALLQHDTNNSKLLLLSAVFTTVTTVATSTTTSTATVAMTAATIPVATAVALERRRRDRKPNGLEDQNHSNHVSGESAPPVSLLTNGMVSLHSLAKQAKTIIIKRRWQCSSAQPACYIASLSAHCGVDSASSGKTRRCVSRCAVCSFPLLF
jgi:hypothetical protein